MHLLTIFLQFLLPLAVLAAPATTKHQPGKQEIVHSHSFTIRSSVFSPAQSKFENLYLEPYHIYPGFDYATLWPKTDRTAGIVGFLNGTRRELRNQQGNLLVPIGAGGILGFVI
ncbi:MAG: hypothetical protein Q9198_009539, partial [Flavoplaca austrocitrina]